MRQLFATLALLSVIGMTATAEQKSGSPPTQAQTCRLKVSGMFCGACAKTVEKTAKKIDGVTAVKVSQPKGLAEITYDPAKTNPDTIAKALTAKTRFKAEAEKHTEQK